MSVRKLILGMIVGIHWWILPVSYLTVKQVIAYNLLCLGIKIFLKINNNKNIWSIQLYHKITVILFCNSNEYTAASFTD